MSTQLNKEFSKRDVQRMRNILTNNTANKTRVQSGYEKENKVYVEGDIWEENGKTWMPSFHNIDGKGMVFANGSGRDDWFWSAVKSIPVLKEEKEKYKGAKTRADMTTIQNFREKDFMDALSYVNLIP